jgi:hypothetical protein
MSDPLAPYTPTGLLTEDDAVDAMCVWEEIDSLTIPDVDTLTAPDGEAQDVRSNWVQYRDLLGSPELRRQSIALGRYAREIAEAIPEEAMEARSFDYAVVPEVLRNVTFKEGPGAWVGEKGLLLVLPPVAELAQKIGDDFMLDNFISEADRLLKERYAMTFTDDAGMDKDDMRNEFWNADPSDRMTVEEAVDWYGQKHDLQRTDVAFQPRP